MAAANMFRAVSLLSALRFFEQFASDYPAVRLTTPQQGYLRTCFKGHKYLIHDSLTVVPAALTQLKSNYIRQHWVGLLLDFAICPPDKIFGIPMSAPGCVFVAALVPTLAGK